MTWAELVADFRNLGGTLENAELREGPNGRGLFAVDPSLPASIVSPYALAIPGADIVAIDGELRVRESSSAAPAARAFFEAYHRHFGWSAGGAEQTRRSQDAWHALAPDIRAAILATGGLADPQRRFAEPDEATCMQIYLANRYFLFDGSLHAFPMIDLVNHSSFAPTYSTHGGFGTSYVVEGELLVNYNSCDPWGIMLNYGFAARGPAANSLGISVDLGTATLRVDRETTVLVRENEMRLPALQRNGSALMLPFLVLGFSPAPELPRTILHRVLDGFERSAVDRLFDAIAHYNRTRFIALLRLLRGARGPLYRELEEAAIDQLEALSFAVGAR